MIVVWCFALSSSHDIITPFWWALFNEQLFSYYLYEDYIYIYIYIYICIYIKKLLKVKPHAEVIAFGAYMFESLQKFKPTANMSKLQNLSAISMCY